MVHKYLFSAIPIHRELPRNGDPDHLGHLVHGDLKHTALLHESQAQADGLRLRMLQPGQRELELPGAAGLRGGGQLFKSEAGHMVPGLHLELKHGDVSLPLLHQILRHLSAPGRPIAVRNDLIVLQIFHRLLM